MKTYRPNSWSTQARGICKNIVISVERGYMSVDDALSWFSRSYRAPLIKRRACKRFGRLWRQGKIHLNIKTSSD